MNRVSLLLFPVALLLTAGQCLAQFVKPVPDGPLGEVDTTFQTEYENLTFHYVKTIGEALRFSLPAVSESTAAKMLSTTPVHDKAFAQA
jgi:hypothetical protein